ncbi:MAG: SDR family oxidoreductase [bacterium]
MKKYFEGKTALITGASSGIGRETALRLASDGARVALCARSGKKLEEIRKLIAERGGKADHYAMDVRDRKNVFEAMRDAWERLGGLDILVANAGVGYIGPIETMPESEILRVLETNLVGTVNCVQAAIPLMRKQGSGTIVLVSSVLGRRAVPYYAVYSASKFAVCGLAEALRLETRDYGIKVILVCPTSTDTDFFKNAGGSVTARKKPLGPFVMSPEKAAEEIVKAIRRGKREAVLSVPAGLFDKAGRLFPRLTDLLILKYFGKQ